MLDNEFTPSYIGVDRRNEGMNGTPLSLVDGSRLVIEAAVQAGAEVFIGYPITPANLLYAYAERRFPEFYAAPDEISALQWAAGYAAAGKTAVTATSFPGFALMVESLNMAFMMELPLVIVLVQRLGPSTGSATVGAQGDLLLLNGVISGGYALPVFCPADLLDCRRLAAVSVHVARALRTPVVLLTSKEMMMTQKSIDLNNLPAVAPIEPKPIDPDNYQPYRAGSDLVPPAASVGDPRLCVRFNASTHDETGLIRGTSAQALANTRRLRDKIATRMEAFQFFSLDEEPGAEEIVISYGVSDAAARVAVRELRCRGRRIDRLTLQTLLPVSEKIMALLRRYRAVWVVEENITGAMRRLLFGFDQPQRVFSIGRIGRPVAPMTIAEEVESCRPLS